MKYRVYITGTFKKSVEVNASSLDSAKEKVEKMYYNSEVELNHENVSDVKFEAEKVEDFTKANRDFKFDKSEWMNLRIIVDAMANPSSYDYISELNDDLRIITSYEKVRKSGKYNMITEMNKAMTEASLKLDEYVYAVVNYGRLIQLVK